jgi:probable phosphoglycerate mutase
MVHDAAMQQTITRLVVVRHGETAWNRDTRIQGHTDVPLNERGLWQARQAAKALKDEGLSAIYSSDLQRAALTAQAIAQVCQVPLHYSDQLRERHFGHLEGLTHDEISTQWPEDAQRWRGRDPAYGPAGGETLTLFYERCLSALNRLASLHPGESVAVVAHGGVLDCFYRAATHVGLEAPRSWQIANASINRLLHTPEGLSLVGWADVAHLDEAGLDENTDGSTAKGAEGQARL